MSESEPLTSSSESGELPQTSLSARMMNVFVSPAEVFDEVRSSKSHAANWVVPVAIGIVVGILAVVLIYSNPQIIQNLRDAQEKQFQKMVDSGKITQAQADQQMAMTQRFMTPTVMIVFGVSWVVIATPIMAMLIALYIWLMGSMAFRGGFDYLKALEVVGLANMVGILCSVVTLLLILIYGDLRMNSGPVLFINHFDDKNKFHLFLAACDVLWLWYLTALSIGMSRLSRASLIKCAICIFGIWAVIKLALISLVLLFTGGN